MSEVIDGGGSVETIATPAQRFMCAVSHWSDDHRVGRVSVTAYAMSLDGYKSHRMWFGDEESTLFVVRQTNEDTVELESIISYPDRQGQGRIVMDRLCYLADDFGVRIWLDAHPYGRERELISLGKLQSFYQSFGFVPVQQIDPRWVSDFYALVGLTIDHPMIRNPQAQSVPAEGATGQE